VEVWVTGPAPVSHSMLGCVSRANCPKSDFKLKDRSTGQST